MKNLEKPLYSLIPLEDFKSLLTIDERENNKAVFCLVTSTLTIEKYCKRRLLRKKHFEQIPFYGDLFLPLGEYPVTELLAVYTVGNERLKMNNEELLETDFYRVVPDCGTDLDIPFYMEISPAIARMGCKAVRAIYWAGYSINNEQLTINNEERIKRGYVPADLASACLELAAWNMNRYRGQRIGMTGNIKGAGKEGEHFEMSMPENVRTLLEPYRRKVI